MVIGRKKVIQFQLSGRSLSSNIPCGHKYPKQGTKE
jgi:hypothetical protein